MSAAAESAADHEKAASLVAKIISAYGGKAAVEGVRSLRMKGNIEAFMLKDQGTYELFFKRGRKLRVETRYRNSSEIRILNGNRGYRSTDKIGGEEVQGPRYLSMVYHYKHLNIVYDLAQGNYETRYAGKLLNGAEVLKLLDGEGAVIELVLNPTSGQILRVTARFLEKNKQMDLSTEYADYRKVEDSLYPYRITQYASGFKVAETIVHSYELNPEIADTLFLPTAADSL